MKYDDLKLPLALGIIGYLFSTTQWIIFLNGLNPYVRLVLYYIILIILIVILEYFELVVSGIRLTTLPQTIGTIFILFAFFISVDIQSCHVDVILGRPCGVEKDPSKQSEDEVVYQFWSNFFENRQVLRIMTYVITPIILSLIGIFLITDDITLSPFRVMRRKR